MKLKLPKIYRNNRYMKLQSRIETFCMGIFYLGNQSAHHGVLDRKEVARILLELDEPSNAMVEDNSGQAAISWMIVNMAPVVC